MLESLRVEMPSASALPRGEGDFADRCRWMDRETFVAHVTEAVAHLHDGAWLAQCPLTELLTVDGDPGEALSNTLAAAIRELRPADDQRVSSPQWRQYRHLLIRYILGASPRELARELNVSERQARRDHLDALEMLAARLWRRWSLGLDMASDEVLEDDLFSAADASIAERDKAMQAEVGRLGAASSVTPLLVEETVRGVLGTVERLAVSRGVAFTTRFPSDPCFVSIDHAVLRQILLNLLTWLIESCHDAGVRLLVQDRPSRRISSAGQTGDPARPSVEIVLEVVSSAGSRAFADSDDPRLAISRRLVSAQGGSLWAPDDEGGTWAIYLRLPAAWAPTVLVIDDNPDFVRLFQRYLGNRAYRVHHANTAERALRLAREDLKPNVITLDVMMPSLDGWEILQILKSDADTRNIPIIVCSVLREEALAQSLGAAAFLTKPVRQSALVAALERCCAGPA